MSSWREQMHEALEAFEEVSALAGDRITPSEMRVEYLEAPHRPTSSLPLGWMAVYAFWGDGEWLKIGKVGPRSNARFTSQHYNPKSSRSNLARSLQDDPAMRSRAGFDKQDPGAWIRRETHRVNILVHMKRSKALLALLEAFLHLRLGPRYEG